MIARHADRMQILYLMVTGASTVFDRRARSHAAQREVLGKKNHGAEVHRGIKTQVMTVSGQQAHSEKVFCCGHDPSGSIETWNALLSLGFSYQASVQQES